LEEPAFLVVFLQEGEGVVEVQIELVKEEGVLQEEEALEDYLEVQQKN